MRWKWNVGTYETDYRDWFIPNPSFTIEVKCRGIFREKPTLEVLQAKLLEVLEQEGANHAFGRFDNRPRLFQADATTSYMPGPDFTSLRCNGWYITATREGF